MISIEAHRRLAAEAGLREPRGGSVVVQGFCVYGLADTELASLSPCEPSMFVLASFVHLDQTGKELPTRNTARARPIGKPIDVDDTTKVPKHFPRIHAVVAARERLRTEALRRRGRRPGA